MSKLRNLLGRFAEPFAEWRERKLTYDELMGLDDHMLSDIGICRGEIPGIVSGVTLPRKANHVAAHRGHAAA